MSLDIDLIPDARPLFSIRPRPSYALLEPLIAALGETIDAALNGRTGAETEGILMKAAWNAEPGSDVRQLLLDMYSAALQFPTARWNIC